MAIFIVVVDVRLAGQDKFVVQAQSKTGAISLLQNHYQKMAINLSSLKDARYHHCISSIKELEKSVYQVQDAYDGMD